MPLINSLYQDEFTRILGWKTVETDEELLAYLNLNPYRIMKYLTLGSKQGKEYLGLRACLKELNLDLEIYYNEKGKPYLPTNKQVSITHSFDMVCVGLSKFDIGIDIEKRRPNKLINIKEKFIRKDESEWISKEFEKEYLQVIWGVKEGLYKLDGGNLWNFLHHYRVSPFEFGNGSPINCWISDGFQSRKFHAYYSMIEDYCLVWVLDFD